MHTTKGDKIKIEEVCLKNRAGEYIYVAVRLKYSEINELRSTPRQ